MTKELNKNYQSYRRMKNKKSKLALFFTAFLPEMIFRTTKIEHPHLTRKTVNSALR